MLLAVAEPEPEPEVVEEIAMSVVDPEMSLIDAIYQRRSVRGYLDKEIPETVLKRIFTIAQQTPSNCNVQPWRVYVATGQLKDKLREAMVNNIKNGVEQNSDYHYRGDFVDQYRTRQVACAVELYRNMGIERDDKQGRFDAFLRNYEFFDAPYIAFLGMDKDFGTTVALDVGMYAQTLMLTMAAFGIGSCAMGSMRSYPDLVRDAFAINDETKILFGMAFGYEDASVSANKTKVGREEFAMNVMIKES